MNNDTDDLRDEYPRALIESGREGQVHPSLPRGHQRDPDRSRPLPALSRFRGGQSGLASISRKPTLGDLTWSIPFRQIPRCRCSRRYAIPATKASAVSTWPGSSRTSGLTRTLVSTARVPASHERSNTLVHVAGATCIGWRGEQGIVDVPRGVLRRPPDDHFVSPFAPLDGRARSRSQLVPNARRYRDPALRSDSGFDPFHPKFLRLLLKDITALNLRSTSDADQAHRDFRPMVPNQSPGHRAWIASYAAIGLMAPV